MFKIITEEKETEGVITMGEMKPLQIAEVVDKTGVSEAYAGSIVMRTADTVKFEVMNLSNPRPEGCWTARAGILKVKLLPPGTRITLEVTK